MKKKEDKTTAGKMSFVKHLAELRIRLIRYFLVLFVCVLAAYAFHREILEVIRKPIDEPLQKYTQQTKSKPIKEVEQPISKKGYRCHCWPAKSAKTPGLPISQPIKGALSSGNPSKEAQEKLQCECVREGEIATVSAPSKMQASTSSMVFLHLPEMFFTYMKVAFFAGLFFSFPYLLLELWGFLRPALYVGERRLFLIFAVLSFFGFIGGGLFGYFFVFPHGFDFFLSLTEPEKIMPSLSIAYYLSFVLKLLFAFGLVFELPFVVFVLSRLGMITPKWMLQNAKYSLLGICVFSALLTPPDPFTMLMMAVPLWGLYLLSIGVCYLSSTSTKESKI